MMLYESDRLRLEAVDRVATLWLDSSDGNMVSRPLLRELDGAMNVAAGHPNLEVLVIRSGRAGVFLVGPSTADYEALGDAELRRDFSFAGQRLHDRIRQISRRTRTVALIEGVCRNAGLELALACDFRLAIARPETQIGCDYLERGRLPCHGAAVRLPRQIGLHNALDMLMHSRDIPARAAKQLGLVDHAFGPRPAKTELWWFIADLQARAPRRKVRRSLFTRLREHRLLFRQTVIPRYENIGGVQGKVLLDTVMQGWCKSQAMGFAAERTAFVRDCLHPDSAALRARSRRHEQLMAQFGDICSPRLVAIAGADETGSKLAAIALRAGCDVAIWETDTIQRFEGKRRLERLLRQAVDDGWLNAIEAGQKRDATHVSKHDVGFDAAELILLTGSGDTQQRDLTRLDACSDENAVLVTINFSPAMQDLRRPRRIVSLRFAGGDSRDVEIVPTSLTAEATTAKLYFWLTRCGLRPKLSATSAAEPALFAA